MDLNKEILKLSNKQEWNHQYYLPGGLKTRKTDINSPGYNINKWKRLKPLFENILINQTSFLDVGCSDGYYSIEIAKLKKSFQVTGIDIDNIRIKRSNLMKKIFNISNVNFYKEDLYNLINKEKKFDAVIGLGLLHRVPNIIKCIQKMCKIGNIIIVEFKTIVGEKDEYKVTKGNTKSNKYNCLHGVPTINFVKNRFIELGFKHITIYKDNISKLLYKRTIIVASKDKI